MTTLNDLSETELQQLKQDIDFAELEHRKWLDTTRFCDNNDCSENIMKYATPLLKKAIEANIVQIEIPSEYSPARIMFVKTENKLCEVGSNEN